MYLFQFQREPQENLEQVQSLLLAAQPPRQLPLLPGEPQQQQQEQQLPLLPGESSEVQHPRLQGQRQGEFSQPWKVKVILP